MTRAVAEYQAEQAKTGKKQGLHAVCFDIQKQYLQETGKVISLNHKTLNNLAKGGRSISEFNAEKRWLLDAEEENIIEYTLDCASRGFPLDHKQLKAAGDDTARARLGDDFPESGVGEQWTGRFIERHSDHLHMYGTWGLDKSHTQAMNETMNAAWYEMLGTLLNGHNSHYTRRFLDYAQEHNIHVLCYPAHGTHIYQGLNVAVFSVLKRYWAEERDKAMREG